MRWCGVSDILTMARWPLNRLKPHPKNAAIYGDSADPELVRSVREHGVLTPLTVTANGVVVSGHRRLVAAQEAGLTDVPVAPFGSEDELDIIEALIESNRQRSKTNEQIGREADELHGVIAARQARGGRGKTVRDIAHGLVSDRRTDAQVAKKVGVGQKKAEEARQVVKVVDRLSQSGKTKQEAESLRRTLNDKSVHRAYTEARKNGHIAPPAKIEKEQPQAATASSVALVLRTHTGDEVAYSLPKSKPTFNETQGDGISWARWSWNPVTGCLHGCVYCYAREIATNERYANAFPVGFTPLFHHERLSAPANTVLPTEHRAEAQPCDPDNGCPYERVFVCSMADLYGRWVPQDWIDAVHESMLASPQWQYILLTKFPSRYIGLALPPGAWVGTSVDEQKRVRIAEEAFRKVDGVAVKWLSLEPLREPLEFNDLSMFDWVVIGAQTQTQQPDGLEPAFAPPAEWVVRITAQAMEAGCKVHWKPNLRVEPGMRWLNQYPFAGSRRRQPALSGLA